MKKLIKKVVLTAVAVVGMVFSVHAICVNGTKVHSDGYMIPFPGSAVKFLICNDGVWVAGECFPGTYFSETKQQCVLPI